MFTKRRTSEPASGRPAAHGPRLSRYPASRRPPRRLAAAAGFAFILTVIAALALAGAMSAPPRLRTAEISRLSAIMPALHAVLGGTAGAGAPATQQGAPLQTAAVTARSTATPPLSLLQALVALGKQAAHFMRLDTKSVFGPTKQDIPVSVKQGETLSQVLAKTAGSEDDAHAAIKALRSYFNPRHLRPDQPITVTVQRPRRSHPVLDFLLDPLESAIDRRTQLIGLSIRTDADRHIDLVRQDNGKFTGEKVVIPLTKQVVRARGTISSSLYGDAHDAGIPDSVIVAMMKLYTYSLDFQREIYPGDTFEVVYERYVDKKGRPLKAGDILFASMTNGHKRRPLYRFETRKGIFDYFDELGRSAKKFLMRTPVDAVRISSRFGRRYHPIQKRWKNHYGVDFAAPTGTSIYAAGDGTVAYAGWARGYGRYIKIRHANGYETRYGHMSRILVKRGAHVRQGQLIGRVGMTGWATGPHLHYEVRINGKPYDPLKIKGATTLRLKGKKLERFKKALGKLKTVIAEAPLLSTMKTAQLDEKKEDKNFVQ